MRIALGLIALLISGCASSRVSELSLDYGYYVAPERAYSWPIYPERPKESLALNMNISPASWFHWKNRIHATTTSAQYRHVGWQLGLFVQPLDWLEVGFEHHSQHLLDRQGEHHFPVEDQVMVKLYLLGGNR